MKKQKQERFTIAEAFDYFMAPNSGNGSSDERDALNIERSIRAVGFLLNMCSDMGNRDMEGNAANGLGYVLNHVADQLR